MIISHSRKFVFIHPHRSAGTSIANALIPYLSNRDEVFGYTDDRELISNDNRLKNKKTNQSEQGENPWKHSTAKWTKKYLGNDKWDSYFKFTFVRNPWDIHLSNYFWWKKGSDWSASEKDLKQRESAIKEMSYPEFIKSGESWNHTLLDFILPEKDGAISVNDIFSRPNEISNFKDRIDYIGRFERLASDFSYLCGRLGLPNIELEHLNSSFEEEEEEEREGHLDYLGEDEEARSLLKEKHLLDSKYLEYTEDFSEYNSKWDFYMK